MVTVPYLKKNSKYFIVDAQTLMPICDVEYDNVHDFHDGKAAVEIAGKYGFIDRDGNLIIKPQYSYARPFREGLAVVEIETKLGRKNGAIDFLGQWVIPPKNGLLRDFENGKAIYRDEHGFWGVLDKENNCVVSATYKEETDLLDEHFFNDIQVDQEIPLYTEYSLGHITIKQIDDSFKFAVFDGANNMIIPPTFDSGWYSPNSDAVRVSLNNKVGYLNSISGKCLIECKYGGYSGNFSEGLARVYQYPYGVLGGKPYFIDINGKEFYGQY
jgi:WG containing repeat